MGRKRMDLTGQKFGLWTVLAGAGGKTFIRGNGQRQTQFRWLCRCRCGVEREVFQTLLKSGKSQSCGCAAFGKGQDELPGSTWKPVAGLPEYEASDKGQVRNFIRGAPFIMKPTTDKKGYFYVSVKRGKQIFIERVHRLVLKAFVGLPPTSGHQAAHWDADRKNNAVENLRWASPGENMADKLHQGRVPLSAEDVCDIRAKYTGRWGQQTELAEEYGVTRCMIHGIIRGKTYTSLD